MTTVPSKIKDRIEIKPNAQFKSLLTRTRKYLTTLTWLFSILETITALVAGAFVGAAITGKFVGGAVAVCLLYSVFLTIKIYGRKLFPGSLFGELEAQERLFELRFLSVHRSRES